MKGMKDVKEGSFDALPAGRYLGLITAATVTTTKDGTKSMIKATIDIREPEEFAGRKVFDQFVTESNYYGKVKLRGLGIDVDGDDIADEEIVNRITGLEVQVDVLTELSFTKDANENLIPKFTLDANGHQVQEQRNSVKGYSLLSVGGALGATATPALATATAAPAANHAPAPAQAAVPPWLATQANARATGPQHPAATATANGKGALKGKK